MIKDWLGCILSILGVPWGSLGFLGVKRRTPYICKNGNNCQRLIKIDIYFSQKGRHVVHELKSKLTLIGRNFNINCETERVSASPYCVISCNAFCTNKHTDRYISYSLFSTLYKLCQKIFDYNNEICGFCNASDFCNLNYIHIHVSILIVLFYYLISFDLEFYITINLLPKNGNKRHKKQLGLIGKLLSDFKLNEIIFY